MIATKTLLLILEELKLRQFSSLRKKPQSKRGSLMAMRAIMQDIANALNHHPHCHPCEVNGVPVVLCEHVHDAFGHEIEIVIAAPRQLAGVSSGVFGGRHARDARKQCMAVVAIAVDDAFHEGKYQGVNYHCK